MTTQLSIKLKEHTSIHSWFIVGGGMQSQADKSEESKLMENGTSGSIAASNTAVINSSNGVTTSAVGKTSVTNPTSDQSKDTGSKDETIQNKE